MTVLDLPSRLSYLSEELQDIFNHIYQYDSSVGRLKIPEAMQEWVKKQFGSIEAVQDQKLMRIENKVTKEGVIYNSLRANRPQVKVAEFDIANLLTEAMDGPFATPFEMTPEDVFGRVKGEHCITASNVAKYDAWHGVIIFNQSNPFLWTQEQVVDYLSVAKQWFDKVHENDSEAIFPLFQWNSLWRAAASIVHGHAQVTVAQRRPYAQVEQLRQGSENYQKEFGSNYFEDLFTLHQALELAWEHEGIKMIIPITPKKEREIQIISPEFGENLAVALHRILSAYRDGLHVYSFNIAAYLHPLKEVEGWDHMPIVLRLIDRGDLSNRNSDLGVMERFAQEVIEHDPYRTFEAVQESLSN